MNPKYWEEKWKIGDTRFHLGIPHPSLKKHFSSEPPQKVLVPLCGKSQDLLWLYAQGHDVVGIELSPIACKAFFTENKIPFQKESREPGTLYYADRISLWCGDFFQAPPAVWTGCRAVYDRAALVALPAEFRKQYARHLTDKLVKPASAAKMLLIAVQYESPTENGPPFSVTETEVRNLYGDAFEIKLLDTQKDDSLSGRPPKFTNLEVHESTYRLTAKPIS